jgi:hypothetical protein
MKRLSLLIVAATLLMCGCNAATHATQPTQPILPPIAYEPLTWTVTVPPLASVNDPAGFTSPPIFLGSGIGEPGEALTPAECSNDFTVYGLPAAAATGVGCGLGEEFLDSNAPPAGQPLLTLLVSDNIETSWVRGEAMQMWVVLVVCNSTCDQQYQLGGLLTEQFDAAGNVELAGPMTCLGGGLCTVGDTVTGVTLQ